MAKVSVGLYRCFRKQSCFPARATKETAKADKRIEREFIYWFQVGGDFFENELHRLLCSCTEKRPVVTCLVHGLFLSSFSETPVSCDFVHREVSL